MAEARPDRATLAAFVASVVLLGSNFVAVRFSNAELAPFWGAALRFGAASLVVWVLMAARGIAFPRGRALAGAALFGLLAFALNFGLLYTALRPGGVPAGTASVVFATIPLSTLLLAVLAGLERPRPMAFVGAAVVLAGVAAMSWSGLRAGVPGVLLLAVAAASLCAALSGVVVKAFPRNHPLAANAVAMPLASVLLALASAASGEAHAWPTRQATWLALAWLVLGSVVAFAAMVYVIGRWTASANAYGAVLQPLVTIPVAAWLAHEGVGVRFLAGAVLVLLGVYLGALRRAPATAPPPPAPSRAG